ncbi:unnamed protein product [Schistosoma curassoni]|uniref:LisH domain-containing protein n=1 Tax=Schistosoma curassoni TaxID=6186 RepID=A0A183KE64_9TREM|nr:unnamed protein product [Schistosoma curassoni]
MEPAMEKLGIYSTSEAFEDYFERFEIWAMTKEDDEDVNIIAHFLTFIGKESYSLLRTMAMPEKPISLPYTALKELLLDYVNYTNFEHGKGGRSSRMIHEDLKNSTTLLRHLNPVHTQGYADNSLRSCNAFHEDGHKFEESNPDVILNIICPHDAFDPCEKLAQCEARVLNDLDFDYNSNDFISTAIHPYHKSTSDVYSNQYINDFITKSNDDCIQFQDPGESVPISVVNSNTNECILDNTEFLSNTMSDRLRMNLRRRRTYDYRHLDSNLSCGGCGV